MASFGIAPVAANAKLVELNVGGFMYTTNSTTLTNFPDSLLGSIFTNETETECLLKDSRGRYFLDRDGELFRYVIIYTVN